MRATETRSIKTKATIVEVKLLSDVLSDELLLAPQIELPPPNKPLHSVKSNI